MLGNTTEDVLVYAHEDSGRGKAPTIVVQVYVRDNPDALRRHSSHRKVLEASVKKPLR